MNPSASLYHTLKTELTKQGLEHLFYFYEIKKHWDVIVPGKLASKVAPAKLENNTLILHVEDSAYTYHLKPYVKNMLSYIRVAIQSRAVTQIQFRVGALSNLPFQMEADQKIAEHSRALKPISETVEAESCSANIKNPRTRKHFKRWMNKTLQRGKQRNNHG